MKTFLKELIIVLLLILAILLVLGVLLYDYIPMNKVVPQIEQYETPDNIKEELEENVNENETSSSTIVYEINESDLKLYEKSNDYQKGKVNPFAEIESSTTADSETTENGGDNTTNSDSDTTITNTNSEGTYLPSTGTK
jgi:hypothetical protein